MPLILPKELQNEWLNPINDNPDQEFLDKQAINELIRPYEDGEMEAHTVKRLTGKQSVPNGTDKLDEYIFEDFDYPDLSKI